jgi:hypothetical protein
MRRLCRAQVVEGWCVELIEQPIADVSQIDEVGGVDNQPTMPVSGRLSSGSGSTQGQGQTAE